MPEYSEYYKARKIITDILGNDFIGPVSEKEILAELPTQYYIMGKLYPKGSFALPTEMFDPLLENQAGTYDASIALSNQNYPSSLGITFAVKINVSEVVLTGSYAFYTPVPFDNADAYKLNISQWKNMEKKPEYLWIRNAYEFSNSVKLEPGQSTAPVILQNGLQLQIYTHAVFSDGTRIITAAIVNTNKADFDRVANAEKCAFQVALKITGDSNEPVFAPVNKEKKLSVDKELLELAMLYSDNLCYAQGHGCSVEWDHESDVPTWIALSWLPSYNLQQMRPRKIKDKCVLSMQFLAFSQDQVVISALNNFVNDYKNWIAALTTKVSSLEKLYQVSAKENIYKCSQAALRMQKTIKLLQKSAYGDGKDIRAFKLANEAMLLQRCQTLKKRGVAFEQNKICWYPFQLGFMLHELSSFITPESKEREIVDLLWFPTGGGKTEAYLGIAAFTIFLRRLRDSKNDGVTVIMRYTLRLLTLQQFERASILILACEKLRQKYNLGGSEISIGLWVGGQLTPNTLDEADKSIKQQIQDDKLEFAQEANACQIQVCPWCGHDISPRDYTVDFSRKRMVIKCSNSACYFHKLGNGLPLHIIDEAIYEYLPTFVVATIDKFAQLPLNDKPAALFGISRYKQPPELIIQDELHLISGPLGTLTGIYEAAITTLCRTKDSNIGAKVIASTATIRNASNQIHALYGKQYAQFPPQGITVRDSYFAVEASSEESPARLYLGVMGTGTTGTTALIRVYAAVLFATRYLAALGYDEKVVDNFWTIVGYFNSLRELGGASTNIHDSVMSRFSYLANTKFAGLGARVDTSRFYDQLLELTGRMNNRDITDIIQRKLQRKYKRSKYIDAYDFVLASNMISVGVDVGRLGCMVVAGQPKTNAEYIQATSRIGRTNPGLVLTVYNGAKSRDRSHYEQFLKYHSALYRYVESTSLTPFTDRARDRGLHALYVTLCRYLVPGLLPNENAANYDRMSPEVERIKKIILDYVRQVDKSELAAVRNELEDIAKDWHWAARKPLKYRSFRITDNTLLKRSTENDRFRTMNSMRNVDVQSGIYLLGKE